MLQNNTNKCSQIDILYKQLLALVKGHIEISLLLILALYLLRLLSNLCQSSKIKYYSCKNNSLCILYININVTMFLYLKLVYWQSIKEFLCNKYTELPRNIVNRMIPIYFYSLSCNTLFIMSDSIFLVFIDYWFNVSAFCA